MKSNDILPGSTKSQDFKPGKITKEQFKQGCFRLHIDSEESLINSHHIEKYVVDENLINRSIITVQGMS